MILLILLYLSFGSSFALPTPSDLSIDIPPSLFTRNADRFGTRSVWGIIWSCFSTIFACTWIAVHPNIPGPKDGVWVVLGRRVSMMVYMLIAPEMVIWWAARQNLGAKRLAKHYQKHGWTMAHGFFLIMGGFTLHDEKQSPLRVLLPEDFEKLFEAGKIAWPSITKEEIQDRSKGDYLSNFIVLLQTSWLITVRGAYGLEVTELEVATLAFAACTLVTYYLWWHKPLDVRCSVPVYLKESLGEGSQIPQQLPLDIIPNESDSQEPTTIFAPSHHSSTTIPEPNFTQNQAFSALIQRRRQEHGILLGLLHVFLLDPLHAFFGTLVDMIVCHTLQDSSPLRVPTFYTPDEGAVVSLRIPLWVGVMYRGIHCSAWSFRFPTPQEQLAWRISAAVVSGSPILFIAMRRLATNFDSIKLGKFFDKVVRLMIFALTAIYVVARITLLVLPCIALQALPAAAYVDIQWASFIPHIG